MWRCLSLLGDLRWIYVVCGGVGSDGGALRGRNEDQTREKKACRLFQVAAAVAVKCNSNT